MDSTDLLPLLEQLDDNVDDLEEVLEPFLTSSLEKASKKLPVMDKAKLHVLITYTLESLIFSYLRLHGVDAKQHPVFRELTRVKQYFEKIKALETEPEQRPMTLDKEAAGRFIRHGLAGNDKLDMERAEQQAKEKARAQIKASLLPRKTSAILRDSPVQTESPSSGAALEASDNDDDDGEDNSNYEMELETKPESQPASQPSCGAESGKEKKRTAKEGNAERRSKEAKIAKKQRRLDKSKRQEMKKERRRKKEEVRKAKTAK